MAERIVYSRVLSGQPLDGTGKLCIHLLVQDQSGPFAVRHALHQTQEGEQLLASRGARARLACDPKRDASPVVRGKVTTITTHTDDPRAVTCPKCAATTEYMETLSKIRSLNS